jgi:hypothetical protein
MPELTDIATAKKPRPPEVAVKIDALGFDSGAFEIPKAEMDRYITIFQPPTGDELV